MSDTKSIISNVSRRDFMKTSSALASSAAVLSAVAPTAHAANDDTINIALIGCGGRGTGAAGQALSTKGKVKLVAIGDAFYDRADGCLKNLKRNKDFQIDVPRERIYDGFDAYKKIIDSPDVDLVILTTPPGFRPIHFEYAIKAGKHVFMEKPVAVDAPGVRKVLAAAAEAKKKNLKVGVGLQRRHQARYLDTVKRLQDGAIGDITTMKAYWNGAGVWVRPRQAGQTEMEYQMRNWYYFNWLCGDHIAEQHIHNLDVCNWVKDAHPVKANGMGGRQVRTGIDHGEIYDHHFVEFEYADGTLMYSQCRHQPGTWSSVSEHAVGTKGKANIGGGRIRATGGWDFRYRGSNANPYQVEHDDLFHAIRNNIPFNEAVYGATSTMTSIFGRMATYSGKSLTWDQAINSNISLSPKSYEWDAAPPTTPDKDGRYPIPMPGKTKVF